MKLRTVIVLVISGAMFSCANVDANKGIQGAGFGSLIGAGIGQAIGKDTEGTLIGAAVGTMVGYIIGNEMDKYDRLNLNNVYENVPSGKVATWNNPDNNNHYEVSPGGAYNIGNKVCREAEIVAIIDGKREKVYSTACRNPLGVWEIQK